MPVGPGRGCPKGMQGSSSLPPPKAGGARVSGQELYNRVVGCARLSAKALVANVSFVFSISTKTNHACRTFSICTTSRGSIRLGASAPPWSQGQWFSAGPRSIDPPFFIRFPASPLTTYHDSLPGIDRNSGDNPEHIGLGEATPRGGVRGEAFGRTKWFHMG